MIILLDYNIWLYYLNIIPDFSNIFIFLSFFLSMLPYFRQIAIKFKLFIYYVPTNTIVIDCQLSIDKLFFRV